MNIDRMNSLYFNPYFFIKRKIIQKSVRKTTENYISNKNLLTAEQKQKVKNFFKQYTTTTTVFHSFYAEKTGVFSELFIPTDIYINYIDEYYNKRYEAKTMDNKCYYPTIFRGIPQADSIALRIGGFWYNANMQIISKNELSKLINAEPAAFIKKATNSYGGKGVQFISAENGVMFSDFEKAIENIGGDIVIQRPLKQHPTLSAFNENSVNTVRVLSLLRDDGVKIYSSIIRMGVGGARVDNASSGGIICGITEDGKLKKRAYKPSGESYEVHPTSGLKFDEYSIPSFDKIKELVRKAHPMVPHFKMVSWDFAVNEHGNPIMIEANLCLGELDFHQLNNGPLFGEDTKKILDEVFQKIKL